MSYNSKGIYAPFYYNEFRCIAGECRHSCCIDWEICIDEITLEKYKQTEYILHTLTEKGGDTCFRLTGEGRCPHLNDKGLCDIIISYGEEYLSQICKNHPRFFNYLKGGRVEAGIGIVCQEACRLILENRAPFYLIKVGEVEESTEIPRDFIDEEFDPIPFRDKIISGIEGLEDSFEGIVTLLCREYELPEIYAENWLDFFLSLEILDEDWKGELRRAKERKNLKNTEADYEKYCKELLIYFIYRHVSVAESHENLRGRLAFAILSTEMIKYLFQGQEEGTFEKFADLARRYSAEIEYSEENTDQLIFEFESSL